MTRELLTQWISELAAPNPKYGGQPTCPFAQNALAKNKVVLEYCGPYLLDRLHRLTYIEPSVDVYVLEFIPHLYDADLLDTIVEQLNTTHPYLLVLATHPKHDDPSHPTLGLVFVQRKADMIAAVDYLRTTSYYDNNPLPEWYDDPRPA
jgi:hypothetical protein